MWYNWIRPVVASVVAETLEVVVVVVVVVAADDNGDVDVR